MPVHDMLRESGGGGRPFARVYERSVEEVRIIEAEKTRRLGMALGNVLIICGLLVSVYAPAGKEIIAYCAGVAMIVFGAGSIGFTAVRAKAIKVLEVSASTVDEKPPDGQGPGNQKP